MIKLRVLAPADGRWSDSDRDQLRAVTADLTSDEADEIYAVIVPAFNSGALRKDLDGPMF